MNKQIFLSLAVMGCCTFSHSSSYDWLEFTGDTAPANSKYYVNKTELLKGSFDKPFLLHMKYVVEMGEMDRVGDSTTVAAYYIDCHQMREVLAEVVTEDNAQLATSTATERKVYFDVRQPPPETAWKRMGIGVNSPNNFCRLVPGWDVKKIKAAYPNSNWRAVDKNNPVFFLNEADLSFATKNKPFPVRAKQFTPIDIAEGEVTAVTFTELIDCKNEKSRPISKLFTADDTVLVENTNPSVLKSEAVNGEWRQFNENNKVFGEICKPLKK